jgi:hypothetical protein
VFSFVCFLSTSLGAGVPFVVSRWKRWGRPHPAGLSACISSLPRCARNDMICGRESLGVPPRPGVLPAFQGVRRAHISRLNIDIYETYRRRTASIYRRPLGGGRPARPGREARPSRPRVKTRQKILRPKSVPARLTSVVIVPFVTIGAKRTQFRQGGQGQGGAKRLTASLQTCKTNPIWSALGPGPEAKCAKRTQFGPAGQGEGGAKRLTASLQTCETNPISPGRGGGRRKLRKTKPNLGGLGHVGKGRRRAVGSAWT